MRSRTSLLLLASITALAFSPSACRGDYRPNYDHDHRDYYLIRISSPHRNPQHPHPSTPDHPPWTLHEDQQLLMGDLLKLRFESRVGLLPDYFLYSSPKPPPAARTLSDVGAGGGLDRASRESQATRSGHSKRSLAALDPPFIPSDQGPRCKPACDKAAQPTVKADPVVDRFHRLKTLHMEQQEHGKLQRRKRNDLNAEVIKVMEAIEKQELRQRARKRAPALDPNSKTVATKRKRDGDETEDDDEQEDMEQSGDDEPVEEDGQTTEQDFDTEFDSNSAYENGDTDEENEEEGEGEVEGEYQAQGEEQPEDYVASTLGIPDPGFHYQWHLV